MPDVRLGENIYEGVKSVKMNTVDGGSTIFHNCAGVVTAIDFTNFDNGTFTETINGNVVTHIVTFDDSGRPSMIDNVAIIWG